MRRVAADRSEDRFLPFIFTSSHSFAYYSSSSSSVCSSSTVNSKPQRRARKKKSKVAAAALISMVKCVRRFRAVFFFIYFGEAFEGVLRFNAVTKLTSSPTVCRPLLLFTVNRCFIHHHTSDEIWMLGWIFSILYFWVQKVENNTQNSLDSLSPFFIHFFTDFSSYRAAERNNRIIIAAVATLLVGNFHFTS